MPVGPPQSRLSDLVKIDCPHGPQTGIIVTGSKYALVDGLKQARLTDTVICCACGEEGHIASGSNYTNCDALKSARVGDVTIGRCDYGCKECKHDRSGVIVTGSSYTFTT